MAVRHRGLLCAAGQYATALEGAASRATAHVDWARTPQVRRQPTFAACQVSTTCVPVSFQHELRCEIHNVASQHQPATFMPAQACMLRSTRSRLSCPLSTATCFRRLSTAGRHWPGGEASFVWCDCLCRRQPRPAISHGSIKHAKPCCQAAACHGTHSPPLPPTYLCLPARNGPPAPGPAPDPAHPAAAAAVPPLLPPQLPPSSAPPAAAPEQPVAGAARRLLWPQTLPVGGKAPPSGPAALHFAAAWTALRAPLGACAPAMGDRGRQQCKLTTW